MDCRSREHRTVSAPADRHLGAAGVFADKWTDSAQPDVAKLVALAAALGRLLSAGIAVGVSLHDSAIAILRRFGKSGRLRDICARAIRGEAVLCVGASEESGGSDLQIVGTEIQSRNDGFAVRGVKKFVCLAPVADHIMVVARSTDHDPDSRHGNVAVIAVPTSQVEVQTPYRKVSAGPLDTARGAHRHMGSRCRARRSPWNRDGGDHSGPGTRTPVVSRSDRGSK